MSGDKSLVEIGDLAGVSKPTDTFINKISEAVTGIAKPWQIERVAKAEGKAEIIKAKAEAESAAFKQITEMDIDPIQKRALVRSLSEETRKQENIESIARIASEQISDDAKPEGMDDDWIDHFFEKCRYTSNEDMQELWARVLSGEANKPGSFSKRTTEFIATMEKDDADIFSKLCCCLFSPTIFRYICWYNNPLFSKVTNISYTEIKHLEDIGLVTVNDITGFILPDQVKSVNSSYFGQTIQYEFQKAEGNDLPIGHVMLSKVGMELSTIAKAASNFEYLKVLEEHYKKENIILRYSLPKIN